MHRFDYSTLPKDLMTPKLMNLVSAIHEFRGKQDLFIEAHPDILGALLDVAKIQSTASSNRIEGIFTSDKRMKEMVLEKAQPRNRDESEIAGYREVLALVHENYDYMAPRPNILLQMHRDLYQFSPAGFAGRYKNVDNQIVETDAEGHARLRFQPVSVFETPGAMEQLTSAFLDAIQKEEIDPLLLIPIFIADFLCIHPFNDGNGRMSRLLTLLTLYRARYIVGKYISLEMLIEKTKDSYYEALEAVSSGWHENENTYKLFVEYMLGVLFNAYKQFSSRVEHLGTQKVSKSQRIRDLFDQTLGRLSKKEILEKCPDISTTTIERTLSELHKEGYIVKLGAGKATEYIKKVE